MAVFRIVPHIDDSSSTIDIQYTTNIFGSWSALITNDPVSEYPKTFSDNNITSDTWLRFRIKDTGGNYTDWSDPIKPQSNKSPVPPSNLCFIYGRIRDLNTQEPLNGAVVRFRATSGTPSSGILHIRDKSVELDDYGWLGIYLSPGVTYEVTCPEASIKESILIPSATNAKYSSLI
jgi:hypothetical protein